MSTIHNGLTIHDPGMRANHNGLTIHDPGCALSTMDLPYMDIESTSSSNSVGVAITQPRVAGEARYPGYLYNKV